MPIPTGAMLSFHRSPSPANLAQAVRDLENGQNPQKLLTQSTPPDGENQRQTAEKPRKNKPRNRLQPDSPNLAQAVRDLDKMPKASRLTFAAIGRNLKLT